MRLTARTLVAALAALAIAITGGTAAFADPPEENRFCPNDRDWLLVPAAFSPTKDKNGDQLVCTKLDGDPDKDNNNPPGEEDDVLDNEFPFLDL